MKEYPTAERVRQLLHYDAESGLFTWKSKTGSMGSGTVAGTPHKEYINIQVDGRQYKAHRLATLWVTGAWPDGEIDHRDGDGKNNRWANLRPAPSRRFNMQNKRKPHKNSSTGYLGVSVQDGKFRARIRVDGKNRCLGLHGTAEDAYAAYVEAKRRLHEGNTL
jgi:hypothetical protein